MICTITESELSVEEKFRIQKQSLIGGTSHRRVCIVTGIHGDELEGQYVCYLLLKKIQEDLSLLDGTLDVYPALNPLGINAMSRGVPQFDLDMNRIFPGNKNGTFMEYTASRIIDDLTGADLVVDIHASNIFLREAPQVRINVISEKTLFPLAEQLNMDFIWIHESSTVLESTLAYSLNSVGTPTLVVEMGVGMRITKSYGEQLTGGILNLMHSMGVYKGDVVDAVRKPRIGRDGEVTFLNANSYGIFLPRASHSEHVAKGDEIGEILDPLTGTVKETFFAPGDGWLFTIREYPVVYAGSLIARILNEGSSS